MIWKGGSYKEDGNETLINFNLIFSMFFSAIYYYFCAQCLVDYPHMHKQGQTSFLCCSFQVLHVLLNPDNVSKNLYDLTIIDSINTIFSINIILTFQWQFFLLLQRSFFSQNRRWVYCGIKVKINSTTYGYDSGSLILSDNLAVLLDIRFSHE